MRDQYVNLTRAQLREKLLAIEEEIRSVVVYLGRFERTGLEVYAKPARDMLREAIDE